MLHRWKAFFTARTRKALALTAAMVIVLMAFPVLELPTKAANNTAGTQVELQNLLNYAGYEEVITLTANIQLTSPIRVKPGAAGHEKKITLDGAGYSLLGGSGATSLIVIDTNVGNYEDAASTKFTLKNITLDGTAAGDAGGVGINWQAGKLILDSNVVIKNHKSHGVQGDRRWMGEPDLIMNDTVTITNNGGDGLNLNYMNCTINGGEISSNGGHGIWATQSGVDYPLTLNNGTIKDNTLSGVYMTGLFAGKYQEFIMNGGSITQNKGGGVFLAGSPPYDEWSFVPRSKMTMTGGSVTNNTWVSAWEYGAGVRGQGILEVNGEATITGNKRLNGRGGQILDNVYITAIDGAETENPIIVSGGLIGEIGLSSAMDEKLGVTLIRGASRARLEKMPLDSGNAALEWYLTGDKAMLKAVSIETPTIITQPPATVQNVLGHKISMSATIPNAGTLSYQWYYTTKNVSSGGTALTEPSASSQLLFDQLLNGYVYCVITNSKPGFTSKSVVSKTSKVNITYAPIPSFDFGTTPDTTNILYGTDVTVTCTLWAPQSGTVTFVDIVNGIETTLAEFTLPTTMIHTFRPAAGQHTLVARYSGGGNYGPEERTLERNITLTPQTALAVNSSSTYTYVPNGKYTATATGGSTDGLVSYNIVAGGTGIGTFSGDKLTVTKAGTIQFTATMAGNISYDPVTSPVFTLTVNAASSSISLAPKTVTYSGGEATYSESDIRSQIGDGAVTYKYYSDAACTNVIAAPAVAGTYYVKATKAETDLYAAVTSAAATLTIGRRSVTITNVTVNDKPYDGKTTASIKTSGNVSGTIASDMVKVVAGTCTFTGTNAGASVAVTASGFSLGGASAVNYILSAQPTVRNAKINQVALSVSVSKVSISCGLPIPALSVSVAGFVNGEGESLSGFGKPTAQVSGSYDTTDISLTSINVQYTGGNATGNYTFSYTNTAPIEIKGVSVVDGDYTADKDVSKWQAGNITITPDNDYTKISTDKINWNSTLVLSSEGTNSVGFYLKKDNGVISNQVTLESKIDTTSPDGDILIKNSSIRSVMNIITFGLFFKDTVNVTISGSDAGSGVAKIEYQKAASEDEYDLNGVWTEASSLRVTPGEKFGVYARITDNVGNVSVINSRGVVVYIDSAADTTEVSYEKLSLADKTANVVLNGNSIDKVKNGTTVLTNNECTVSKNVITFKAAYLESLAVGDYPFTVSYNPMGEVYDAGDAPADTAFTLHVVHKLPTANEFVFTPPSDLTYDGAAKTATVTAKNGGTGMGTITIQYFSGITPLSGTPQNAGIYSVKIDVTAGTDYGAITALDVGTFTIANAPQVKPTGVSGKNPTTLANNDGKLNGVSTLMEYKKQGNGTWQSISDTTIIGLSDGTYLVRLAAKTNYDASEAQEITLTPFAGTPEHQPAAAFNAVGRMLNDTLAGQQYRIGSGVWTSISGTSVNLSSVVTGACTIEVRKLGDGVYTTDSLTQKIIVTKANKTATTKTDETIDNKNDGAIGAVDNTMEWRTSAGSWQPVTGSSITGLADGTYLVRVKAVGAVLESDEQQLVIAAGRKLSVTLPQNVEGVTVSTSDRLSVSYGGSVSFTVTVKSGYDATHMVVKAGNTILTAQGGIYTVSNMQADTTVTVADVADTAKPTASIALGENTWTKFLNTVTFGLFFKETQTVTVTAADDEGSGVKSIEYLLSETVFQTAEEVTGSWKSLTVQDGTGSFSIAPESKQVIYLRVTDNANNVSVINSEGVVLDSLSPTISGVNHEGTYYGDITFHVTDTNLKTVTVDGDTVALTNGAYTIASDNATHTIVATDEADNSTTYTIGVYKIYTVTFVADGNTVAEKSVNHGATLTDIPGVPAKTGYDQKVPVWDTTDYANITGNKTVTAQYTINVYEMTLPTGEGYASATTEDLKVNHGENFSFTVTVKSGYDTSKMVVKAGNTALTMQNGTYTVTNIQADTVITVADVADTAKPTASIALGENTWTKFLNTVTFGLFFKETQTVTVTAADDEGSGVKSLEYLLSETVFDGADAMAESKWTSMACEDGAATFSMKPNSKQFVYVRVIDNAGNAIVINSAGIVLYTNSALVSGKTEFNMDKQKDLVVEMTLADNTLADILLGEAVLEKDVDYIMGGDKVILKKEYLAKALTKAETTLTFRFNPMGEVFEGKDNAPADAAFLIALHEHVWDDGVVTTPATVHESGIKTYTCTDCAFTREESIEKVPVAEKTVSNSTGEVSASGQMSAGAKLSVTPLKSNSDSYQQLIKLVNTDKNKVVGAFEVTVTNGGYVGKLTLSFYVGKAYDGKTLTVYHQKADSTVETLHVVCKDGKANVEVDELSPFLVTAQMDEKDGNPGTGNSYPIAAAGLLVISGGAVLALKTRRGKKNDA